MRSLFGVLIVLGVCAAPPHVQAQGIPTKFTNLQVFPPSTPPEVLVAAMKNFTRALGVRCQFCHVGEEGMPLEKFDFSSDKNPHKDSARAMMRMTAEINGSVTKLFPDAATKGYQVTCWTCHRGSEHPQHAPEAAKPKGE